MNEDELVQKAAAELSAIAKTRMPFGKYGPRNYPPAGVPIYDLPAEYLQYFATKGWPSGKLGHLLQVVYQMKADGGDAVFQTLRERAGGRMKMRKPKRREWNFPPGDNE